MRASSRKSATFTGDGEYKQVVFHLAETKTSRVKISHEHVDYDWVTYEEALKKLTYENSRKTLRRAHKIVMNERYIQNK